MAAMPDCWRLSVIGQRGQALIETTLMLPLVLFASLLVVQLLWISWWQYNLWTSSSYVLRTAAIQGVDERAMLNTLATSMTAVQPRLSRDSNQPAGDYSQLLVAQTKSQLWAQWGAKIEVLQPRADQLQQHGGLIASDHPNLRYQASGDGVSYLAARTIELEIWWCMPLKVPLAGAVLAALRQPLGHPVQGFCQTREVVHDAPLWGLRYRLKGPLLSDYGGRS